MPDLKRRGQAVLGLLLGLTLVLWGCGDSPAQFTSTPVASPSTPPVNVPATATSRPNQTPAQVSPLPPNSPLPAPVVTPTPVPATAPPPTTLTPSPVVTAPTGNPEPTLLVTNSAGRHLSFIDPDSGVIERVEVGGSPWGLALAPGQRAYVATAEGVAVVDTQARRRLSLIPYRARIGSVGYGEYRPGGMGIAVSPDGKRVYVGVHLPNQSSQLEVIDLEKLSSLASIEVGVRPFQVLVSRDGQQVYSIDHDSFQVTVIDPVTFSRRVLKVAPLGNNAFDKPHYAVLRPSDGHLLLPVQGRSLVALDPVTGKTTSLSLKSNTHQHGLALTPDGQKLLIVGTGPAGGASEGPGLTIYNLASGEEEILPLARPHEKVVVSQDGRRAYLTGGYTYANGGWDGLTVIDLKSRTSREIKVADRPLDIALLQGQAN